MEVIGDVGQLDISNFSVSRNGSSLDPFQWRVSCNKCCKKVVKGAGIFCVNLYVGRGQYPPCHRLWYGGCYIKHPKWRMGDHILAHFQCELCHFRNMKGRYPTEGRDKYGRLIISVRRASLDAIWSIELGTDRGDLTMMRKMGTMAK